MAFEPGPSGRRLLAVDFAPTFFEIDPTTGQSAILAEQSSDAPIIGGMAFAASRLHGNGEIDSCEPPCPGDLNGDRAVDIGDLNAVLGNFGTMDDINDLNLVIGNLGTECQ